MSTLARWRSTWMGLGAAPPADEVHAGLIARYQEPHRREILEGFLSRLRVYGTEAFRVRFEDRARTNLARSIRALAT